MAQPCSIRVSVPVSDSFSSLDLRVSKVFATGGDRTLEAIVEVFNLQLGLRFQF